MAQTAKAWTCICGHTIGVHLSAGCWATGCTCPGFIGKGTALDPDVDREAYERAMKALDFKPIPRASVVKGRGKV